MLNSFWGKFGENLYKKTTEAVTTPADLFALVSDTLTLIDIHTHLLTRFLGSSLLESEGKSTRQRTCQHFHCCLHYLLSPFKVILLSRAATTTGLRLRHWFSIFLLETWLTWNSSGRLSGWNDQRIAGFHMTSLNFKLQNYWYSWEFTFIMFKSS